MLNMTCYYYYSTHAWCFDSFNVPMNYANVAYICVWVHQVLPLHSMCVCVCVCVCVGVCVLSSLCILKNQLHQTHSTMEHLPTDTHTHTSMHAYTHAPAHTRVHTTTQPTHTHTHTHVQKENHKKYFFFI